MITGYNTDIKHLDTVFHVQTEDKGTANPFMESLVYVGGQILAAKRQNYASLLEEGKGENEIVKMMEQQHRTMLAAIRAGRFDDKLDTVVSSGKSKPEAQTSVVEQRPEAAAPEQTLDQVILSYLATEAEQEHLVLAIENEVAIRAGGSANVSLLASSSRSGHAVAGAQVMAKMISTVSLPLTLGKGETDSEGRVDLHLEIPRLQGGAAAMIITAASKIGRAEVKRLL